MKTLRIAGPVAFVWLAAALLLPQAAMGQGAPNPREEAAKAACKAKSDPSILINYWKSAGATGSATELENRAKVICVTRGGGSSHSYAIAGNAGPMKVSGTACSLMKPFTVKGGGGGMTVKFSYAPAGETGGKVSYTGGGPGAPMAGAGTYTVTLDGAGGTIKQTHTGKVTIPFGGSATHTDILKLTPIPKC
jgi:hypothetical protein